MLRRLWQNRFQFWTPFFALRFFIRGFPMELGEDFGLRERASAAWNAATACADIKRIARYDMVDWGD